MQCEKCQKRVADFIAKMNGKPLFYIECGLVSAKFGQLLYDWLWSSKRNEKSHCFCWGLVWLLDCRELTVWYSWWIRNSEFLTNYLLPWEMLREEKFIGPYCFCCHILLGRHVFRLQSWGTLLFISVLCTKPTTVISSAFDLFLFATSLPSYMCWRFPPNIMQAQQI